MPNLISFVLNKEEFGPLSVTPSIDGTPLSDLATAFEAASGYEPPGGYGGIVPTSFSYGPLDRYFSGTSEERFWIDEGEIWLLDCSCGEAGCWPLAAKISLHADSYIWSEFRQPHRPGRDYTGFGPFRFERTHYEAALRSIADLG